MLTTTVNGFLHSYYSQIMQSGGSKKTIQALINDLLGDSLLIKDLTIEQLIDIGLPLLLPDASSGESIYYDSDKAGIAASLKVKFLTFNVLIPNQGLKDTLNVLFEKLDEKVFANSAVMDAVVADLVQDLTAVKVSGTDSAEDETDDKTLLDYANYIYQSHLGGEDSGDQPAWVTEATSKIESGALLDDVLKVVIKDLADMLDGVLANVTFEELVGSTEWDAINNCFIPCAEGRTPLLKENDGKGGNIVLLLGPLAAKWDTETGEVNGQNKVIKYLAPEGTINPELGYTMYDFIYSIKLLKFNMEETLTDLLIGTAEEPGLIDNEIKGQINGFLMNVVSSMGTDDNYPEDNKTTITYEWKLLTDRTALDKAITDAEKIDLSQYTDETAKAVTHALSAAKGLSLTATQEEMDHAAQVLNDAIKGLQKIDTTPNNPDNPDEPDVPSNPDKPNIPQTGNSNNMAVCFAFLFVSGVGILSTIVCNKKRKVNR